MSGVMIDFYHYTEPCYRCEAVAWECIGEFVPNKGTRQDVLECAFCGVRLRVNSVAQVKAEPPKATAGEFRFQYGRFAGLTIAEADAQPNGRRYLEVLRNTNEKLKARIEEYLAAVA